MPVSRTRKHQTGFEKQNNINRFSNIVPAEELDIYKDQRSPYVGGLSSNKMSAIGFSADDYNPVKESPFWNNDNAYEF